MDQDATIVAKPGVSTVGTDGDDVIVGTAGSDEIRGGGGNDLICGFGRGDVIRGGPGDDVILGHAGDDTLRGGPGDDTVVGHSGDDTVAGQAGNDRLRGGKGNDRGFGGIGRDDIETDSGADRVRGGPGTDTVAGGPGTDIVVGNADDDVVEGGAGDDRVNGGIGDDQILGNGGNDLLRGRPGDDWLHGGPGFDRLYGGADSDTCDGEVTIACELPVSGGDWAPVSGVAEVTRSWQDCVADFNGDGSFDFYTSRHADAPSQMYYYAGSQQYDEVHVGLFSGGDRHGCATADVNGDGLTDLYTTKGACRGTCQGDNELWLQQSDGSFVDHAAAYGVTDPNGRGRDPVFLDANGDQWPDLFVVNDIGVDHPSPNRLFLGGPSGFTATTGPPNEEIGGWCVDAADYDGDGDDDLIVCSLLRGTIVYENQGGVFIDANSATGIETWGRHELEFVDLDGDGHLDLMSTTETSFQVRFQRDGTYGTADVHVPLTDARSAAAGDADGDGDLDVYVVQGSNPTVSDRVLLNDGTGAFDVILAPDDTDVGDGMSVETIPGFLGDRAAFLISNGWGNTPGPRQLVIVP